MATLPAFQAWYAMQSSVTHFWSPETNTPWLVVDFYSNPSKWIPGSHLGVIVGRWRRGLLVHVTKDEIIFLTNTKSKNTLSFLLWPSKYISDLVLNWTKLIFPLFEAVDNVITLGVTSYSSYLMNLVVFWRLSGSLLKEQTGFLMSELDSV